MKRLILLLSLLLTAVLFVGCGQLSLFCRHEYNDVVTDSTCLIEGEKTRTCTLCGKIKKIPIEKKAHEFSQWTQTAEKTCTADGVRTRICSQCGTEESEVTPCEGHSFGQYVTEIEPSDVCDGLDKRTCLECGETEEKVIQSINYVDTSIFLFDFDGDFRYQVSEESEFIKIATAAVFNGAPEVHFTVGFEYGDLDSLIDRLVDGMLLPFPFSVRASLAGKDLTLGFTYPSEPSEKTSASGIYTQKSSANYQPTVSGRGEDFDSFKIGESAISYSVTTTEQLFYALSCRVNPLPTEGSSAERVYEKMKAVLREIIDDEMTDFEKARAIYDWLIMNVTYDGELLNMLTVGTGDIATETHNAFYLEGVFDDGLAVCDGISKSFAAMANVEGIPCVQVTGLQADDPDGVGHAWNKIYLGGSWYIVDATSGGVIVSGEEIYSLVYFLITDSEMEKRYIGVDHNDLKCDKEYDRFKDTEITYLGTQYDLYVESAIELNAVMNYFSSFSEEGISLQIEIAETFDVGLSPMDEVQSAAMVAGVNFTRYLTEGENGEIITIW